ncbi:alanine aminotransferase 2-like [Engraulis encrasicolus]|uniref:alanine aminotransferase 2-like n=1 Tax=Engraulis encrasicolus TaxID=184585 RepID=UPI002FD393B5
MCEVPVPVSLLKKSYDEELQKTAAAIRHQLAKGGERPYREVLDVSCADGQSKGMAPNTFMRQVLAACLYPELLQDDSLPVDVRQRAESMLGACDGGSVGAYSDTCGNDRVLASVSEFISRRDGGLAADPKHTHLYITSGHQRGLMVILKLLACGRGQTQQQPAVLIPEPHPHTLPRLLDVIGLAALPYRLQEDRGWGLEKTELQRVIQAAGGRYNPRAIYIPNPGDPTGHVQDRRTIRQVIEFAAEENLLLLVDEVYQDCVFGEGCEFLSYKRALFEMGPASSGAVKMASFNSLSNGTLGECGLRAGYMELVNFEDAVLPFVEILLMGDISPPVIGQVGLDVMARPPCPGEPSYSRYIQVEVMCCKNILRENAAKGRSLLNSLPGVNCPPVRGGVYLYTHLTLPQVVGIHAGLVYCQRFLEEEGVCLGLTECGDSSAIGTCCYLRICILMPTHKLCDLLRRLASFHLRFLLRRLASFHPLNLLPSEAPGVISPAHP